MRLIDYVLMAFRNIRRQKLRSALTIFAIVIGATSVTIMLALVTGAKSFFIDQFESTGQLQQVAVAREQDISYEDAKYQNGNNNDLPKLDDALVAKIKQIPHVTGVARYAPVYVFDHLTFGDKKYSIQGTEAVDSNGVVQRVMVAGRDFGPDDTKNVILLSKSYADKMGYNKRYQELVGQKLTLTTQDFYTGDGASIPDPNTMKPGNEPTKQTPTNIEVTILGVVDGEGASLYFPMPWVRPLLTRQRYDQTDADRAAHDAAQRNLRPGQSVPPIKMSLITENDLDKAGYQSLAVKVDQTTNVEGVATQIRGLGVGAATAKDFVDQQSKMFTILGAILGGIGGIALVVAAIGVINTMIMAILERTREIGVMRAVGARRSTVRRLFTFEASILGFWGGVFGVLVGYGLTKIANAVLNKQLANNSVHASNIIHLPLWLVLAVIGITTVIGMLAGLYPARRAAKLDPVEALRYE